MAWWWVLDEVQTNDARAIEAAGDGCAVADRCIEPKLCVAVKEGEFKLEREEKIVHYRL